jgi:hypothetical protein
MLAYFFTHWPLESSDSDEYEDALRAFMRSLAAHPPQGFQQCWALAVQQLPWANRGQMAYEDWYLVGDFAALGVLNEAAVNPPHGETHLAVARMAGGGKGGVYALARGACDPEQIGYATWFGKPANLTYAACLQQLAPITSQTGVALWQRQMVLGPGPEFCLHSAQPLALPDGFQVLQGEVRRAS